MPEKPKDQKAASLLSFRTREGILMIAGLVIIGVELVSGAVLGHEIHRELLVLAAALCGVSVVQWKEK